MALSQLNFLLTVLISVSIIYFRNIFHFIIQKMSFLTETANTSTLQSYFQTIFFPWNILHKIPYRVKAENPLQVLL